MKDKFKICIVGVGYVGLVTAACLAELGNMVWCVDSDSKKINDLNRGIIPFYEPGLENMITANKNVGRINFTTELEIGVKESYFIFIAVGTPSLEDGDVDVSCIKEVARNVALHMEDSKLIVIKSTVPVGTADEVRKIITECILAPGVEFEVLSNPEFLREGCSIEDFMNPDRIVIGATNQKYAELLAEIYRPISSDGQAILMMDVHSAELTKYSSNAMLAVRISFMNELAKICDAVGADIEKVRVGIGTDKRIGPAFLRAGIGYGGSCLPKDIRGLIKIAEKCSIEPYLMNAIDTVNKEQGKYFMDKIVKRFGRDMSGIKLAVWGLAFKPKTDDLREAPALELIRELLSRGAEVNTYDPIALTNVKSIQELRNVNICREMYEALRDADALIIATEWEQFINPDFELIESLMKNKIVFDARNIYDLSQMNVIGFEYYCIGRN